MNFCCPNCEQPTRLIGPEPWWIAGQSEPLGVVALDGTKVAANAALVANRSYERIEEEVHRMLEEAQRIDAEEELLFGPDGRGEELPQGLGRRGERLSRLGEAKARLEEEPARAAQAAQEHLARRQAEEAVKGQKKRGRQPRMVEPTLLGEAKANVTDPDSRVMKTRQGYVQGYNVQALVSEDQVILAVGVTQEVNDVHQLLPMLERINRNLASPICQELSSRVAQGNRTPTPSQNRT